MCLIVEKSKHLHIFGLNFPRIAIKDKIVYKILIQNNSDYITPYKNHPVHFFKNQAILEAEDACRLTHYNCIEFGIHAFTNYLRAFSRLRIIDDINGTIFKAVIPKGTRYFYGDDGDIVSEKLIIKYEIKPNEKDSYNQH